METTHDKGWKDVHLKTTPGKYCKDIELITNLGNENVNHTTTPGKPKRSSPNNYSWQRLK